VTDARADRIAARFEWPLLIAALLVLPALAIEESSIGGSWVTVALVFDWFIWLLFVIELVTMLVVVEDRWRYLREHPLDLVIVLLTPPFAPAALQATRLFRLLRVVRLVKAGFVVRRLVSPAGVRDAAVLTVFIVLVGGAAFAAVENGHHDSPVSAWDGVWWATSTVTTVGYGDLYPATTIGRIIGIIVMASGIGFVALLTATAAARFNTWERREEGVSDELTEVNDRLQRVEAALTALVAHHGLPAPAVLEPTTQPVAD